MRKPKKLPGVYPNSLTQKTVKISSFEISPSCLCRVAVSPMQTTFSEYIMNRAGPVIRQEYTLEYGTDCIEMHTGAVKEGDRVVIIDDLIATGGTLGASIKLLGSSSSLKFPFALEFWSLQRTWAEYSLGSLKRSITVSWLVEYSQLESEIATSCLCNYESPLCDLGRNSLFVALRFTLERLELVSANNHICPTFRESEGRYCGVRLCDWAHRFKGKTLLSILPTFCEEQILELRQLRPVFCRYERIRSRTV